MKAGPSLLIAFELPINESLQLLGHRIPILSTRSLEQLFNLLPSQRKVKLIHQKEATQELQSIDG